MKHSLILHPPGSSWSRIDHWVLDVLGPREHAAAACLGQLEFWQRGVGEGAWVKKGAEDFS